MTTPAGMRRTAAARQGPDPRALATLAGGVAALCLFALLAGLLVTRAVRCGQGSPETHVVAIDGSVTPILVSPQGVAPDQSNVTPIVLPTPRPPEPIKPVEQAADAGQMEAGSVVDFSDSPPIAPPPSPPDERLAAPETGRLVVRTRNTAMLFVGNRQIGIVDREGIELPEGRYRIKVRNRNGVRRRRVSIEAGETTRVRFRL